MWFFKRLISNIAVRKRERRHIMLCHHDALELFLTFLLRVSESLLIFFAVYYHKTFIRDIRELDQVAMTPTKMTIATPAKASWHFSLRIAAKHSGYRSLSLYFLKGTISESFGTDNSYKNGNHNSPKLLLTFFAVSLYTPLNFDDFSCLLCHQ